MQNQESFDLRDYTIERSIAIGGDAEIFFAIHLGTQTHRALKIVQRRPAETDAQFDARLGRLEHEKKLLEKLRHKNVIQLLDAGKEGNTSFLGLELVNNMEATELGKADCGRFAAPMEEHPLRLGVRAQGVWTACSRARRRRHRLPLGRSRHR